MANDEDGKVVRAVCDALKALNKAMDDASMAGITVSFVTANEIGKRNPNWLLGRAVREETILPA